MENKIVLKYKDVVLRDSDIDILDNQCFLNDDIIGFYFAYLSSLCADDDGIDFVQPSVSFCLSNCSDSRKENAEPLNLANKHLVLFSVNDNEKFDGGENGTHWSTLVYDRTKNSFFHLDTMAGNNRSAAEKLYQSVKDFVGKAVPVPNTSSSKRANKQMKKMKAAATAKPKINDSKEVASDAQVVFEECDFVQQSNGVDCGLYVLAIAKAVAEFNCCSKPVQAADWFSYVQKHVNRSIEDHFRQDVKELVEDLKNKA